LILPSSSFECSNCNETVEVFATIFLTSKSGENSLRILLITNGEFFYGTTLFTSDD